MMNNNIHDPLTWADYERLLTARYRAGGHTRETAPHFARGDINAILAGNHWTAGKPTPADPHLLTVAAMLAGLSPDEREAFTERAVKRKQEREKAAQQTGRQHTRAVADRPFDRPRTMPDNETLAKANA
jgi:hypothetical protein